MIYALLADLVFVAHLAFVISVVMGGLLVLRWPVLAWIHVPVIIWGFIVELTGWTCPLTPLEKALLARAGEAAYEGTFIGHYLTPIIYPEGLTMTHRLVLASLVAVVNIVVYAVLLHRRRRTLLG